MVTLDDVAALAGVSRMTASNALRGKSVVKAETAQRVLEAAAKLGYHPNLAARQLSSGRTHIIGLSITDFDLLFPAYFAAQVSDQARARSYQVVMQQTRFSSDFERQMMDSAATQICDGTIICWPSSSDAAVLEFSHAQPLVAFDGFGLEGRMDCVFTPCREGSAAAVAYLIAHGARRVLIVGAAPDSLHDLDSAPTSAGLRLRGAMDALEYAGSECLPDHSVISSGWSRQDGYRTMLRVIGERLGHEDIGDPDPASIRSQVVGLMDSDGLAERLGFDGVFCVCDPVAIGVLKALTDVGIRVPQDVAIVGFDGIEDGAYTNPGLTSVQVDPAEVATACLDMIISRIESTNGETPAPRTRTVTHRLVARGSGERL